MAQFKIVTGEIENWFAGNAVINEVTKGDINEVDLSTHTDFPLAHIIYLGTEYGDGYTTYNYQILLLDTFEESSEESKVDVLDTLDEVMAQFVSSLNRGTLFNSQIRVVVDPPADVLYDQMQNRLYGWSLNVGLLVPNGIKICT